MILKTWFKVCQKTFEPLSNFWIKWQTLAGDYSFWLMISSVIPQFRKKLLKWFLLKMFDSMTSTYFNDSKLSGMNTLSIQIRIKRSFAVWHKKYFIVSFLLWYNS